MRTRAWLIRSADTTGPIVVSDACSAIGPRAASSALTISPALPSVGSSVFPVATDGDGAAEPAGAAEALGAGLALAVGVGLGLGLGLADGAGDGDGAADPDAAGLPDAPADADGAVD